MIAAVIVTYLPDVRQVIELCERLREELDLVVVADNGSGEEMQAWRAVMGDGLVYLDLGSNRGIGTAQNAGIRAARQKGARRILLLDQDSRPAPGMIAALRASAERCEAQDGAACVVAPDYADMETGHHASFVRLGGARVERVRCAGTADDRRALPVDVTIASGLLIPVEILDTVGLMDESLFIDQVDTDWCLRARKMGYRIYVDCTARMLHSLGTDRRRVWAGRWRMLPVHQPQRLYYQWRNTLLLARRAHAHPALTSNTLAALAIKTLTAAVFGPQRTRSAAMCVRGVIDGIRGRAGPYAGVLPGRVPH